MPFASVAQLPQLKDTVLEEWENIPKVDTKNIMDGIP